MHDQGEDHLLAGLAEGSEEAFRALYARYGAPLFRVAWTLLRSRQDAEDAVQEVFLGLVRSRATLGRIESLPAYLFSSLRHAAARLAQRRTSAGPLADEPPARDSAGTGDIDPEVHRLLEQGLAALPLEQREVLTLKIDGQL